MWTRVIDWKRLTTFELASILIAFVGLGSLIYLGKQTKDLGVQTRAAVDQARLTARQTEKATEALDSAAFQGISSQLLELDKQFIDRPEMEPYFNECKGLPLAGLERARVLALADYHLDFFDSAIGQFPHLDLTESDRSAWDTYIRDTFANSPAVCEQLNKHLAWYSLELRNRAKGLCGECQSRRGISTPHRVAK